MSRPGTHSDGFTLLELLAALVVISTEVIATSAVYGTRMGWLLRVAVPLLVAAAVLSAVSMRRARRQGVVSVWLRLLSAVVWVSAGLALAPLAVVVIIGIFYGFLFVASEVGRLFR